MTDQPPPNSIPELWFYLDKRLALIEEKQIAHKEIHAEIQKDLDDHEQRLRTGLSFTATLTGLGGFVALLALIKSFLP